MQKENLLQFIYVKTYFSGCHLVLGALVTQLHTMSWRLNETKEKRSHNYIYQETYMLICRFMLKTELFYMRMMKILVQTYGKRLGTQDKMKKVLKNTRTTRHQDMMTKSLSFTCNPSRVYVDARNKIIWGKKFNGKFDFFPLVADLRFS